MQETNNLSNVMTPFCMAGLHLVPIPKKNGKPVKAPILKGWNKPISTANPAGYSSNADDFINCKGFNFGLYHGASQTLALDLDDVELSIKVIEETTGIHLSSWLNDKARAEIKSPKANRGKLLFKLPADFKEPRLRQLKHEKTVIFELRSGNCQDVIYGQHPEGGDYTFIGNPSQIPPIPAVLLDFLQHWDDWKACFNSVLGIESTPPEIQPRKPIKGDNQAGLRNPIKEFNHKKSVKDVLLANGYKAVGKDRFIRPGSESKAPGAIILRDCMDGIERVFSHGGDVLNDGFAHDAFDCYRILECNGDTTAALNWNQEITKHNQRLHMKAKAGEWKQSDAVDKNTDSEAHKNIKQTADKEAEETEQEPPKEWEKQLPDGTVLDDSHVDILKNINSDYTHVVFGGKNIVVGQRNCQVQGEVYTFEALPEFKKRFLSKPLVGIGKSKNQGDAWLRWPGKNYMPNGTGFYPDMKKCPNGVFNLFRGLQVQPVEGDCSLYLDHIKNIICAGDEVSYNYLISAPSSLYIILGHPCPKTHSARAT
jgi:hypothetical protein